MSYNALRCLVTILFVSCMPAWAADQGAALYKKKCAGCHGGHGEGKSAMKAPALKGTTLSVDQLMERITKGASGSKAPHNKAIAGITDEDAKAIAEHINSLK